MALLSDPLDAQTQLLASIDRLEHWGSHAGPTALRAWEDWADDLLEVRRSLAMALSNLARDGRDRRARRQAGEALMLARATVELAMGDILGV